MDGEHPIQRDLGPVLLGVRHDDAVVHLAFDEPLENPEQVVGRHAEHRRAEAAELVEREDRAARGQLVGESIDEVNLRADGPDGSRAGPNGPG